MEEKGGFMLNFRGRVEVPSIKNFILEDGVKGRELVVFGKVSEDRFNLEMGGAVSPLVGFALALSAFDSRVTE